MLYVEHTLKAAKADIGAAGPSQNQQGHELAEVRYRNGIGSRLDLLDSQRTDDAAQQDLLTLRLAEATNRVTL